ncbi:MAG: prenyltransferase/squalene oxidase repeat-containing protein [Phycisphaerae bacterium]
MFRHSLCVVLSVAAVVAGLPSSASAEAPSRVLPKLMDRATVKAIDRGLNYLSKTQRRDGSWLNQGGWGTYPAVMTSLSAMGLMSGGSTAHSGPYSKEVRRAMSYVLRVAESDSQGVISGSNSGRSMYGHGFSLLFLAMCYGTERDPDNGKRLKKALDKAVKIIEDSQSPKGGWYYTPSSNSDEGSVTVTQLQALRACRNAGIKVSRKVIEDSVKYLKLCQNKDGGICYSARSRGSSRPAISAAAVACFYSAGLYDRQTGGSGPEAEMVEKLVRYVKQNVSVSQGGRYSGYYFYTHMYMSQAMYMRGGKDWQNYYPAMAKKLRGMQAPDGSWNGDNIGTTYGTAIASMILQLPYGYLPVVQR